MCEIVLSFLDVLEVSGVQQEFGLQNFDRGPAVIGLAQVVHRALRELVVDHRELSLVEPDSSIVVRRDLRKVLLHSLSQVVPSTVDRQPLLAPLPVHLHAQSLVLGDEVRKQVSELDVVGQRVLQ